eukprot:9067867-Pyramimonas_sp.AAC.2
MDLPPTGCVIIHTIALNIHIIALNVHNTALNIHIISLNVHTIALHSECASVSSASVHEIELSAQRDARLAFVKAR